MQLHAKQYYVVLVEASINLDPKIKVTKQVEVMMMGKVFVLAAILIMMPIIIIVMLFYVAVHDHDDDTSIVSTVEEEEEECFEGGSESESESESEGEECAVCLSKVGRDEKYWVVGECRHGFHVDCIRHWLNQHSSCPLCRAHVDDLPPNTTTTRTTIHDLLILIINAILNWMASPLDHHLSSSSSSATFILIN